MAYASRKGKNVVLIRDEAGVVLLSHPIRWQSSGNVVELFHVSNFLSSSVGDKSTFKFYNFSNFCKPVHFSKPSISILWTRLLAFYAGSTRSLSGPSCGKCEVRRTQGSPPADDYMSKTVQCFEEFALIYANQNVRNLRPNFYLLNLTNLTWVPLNLMLSHHFPNGKISLQKCGEEMVYLHGDCNLTNCVERTHLYQIDVEPLTDMVHQKRRSKSLNALNFSADFSIADQTRRQSTATSQLKLAKDMGYQEDVILAALPTLQKDKEGSRSMYLPFDSTNAMLDVLNYTASRGNGVPSGDSLETTLNGHSPRSEELARLLRTFERERLRDREAADSHMARLKARIHDLERINDQQQLTEREIRERLNEQQRRNETLNSELKKSEGEREQLSQTVIELQALTDRLLQTLENLRNEHQAKDQKELAEHRKKQHDQQVATMEESIRTLTERCATLSAELKEKEEQLRVQNRRIQEIEDRNSQLPCVLFLPCRHMVICDSCHAETTISECPTCRTRVNDSMKVYS
ncbi:unnamed protein product [Nippostrongylus brasiliensis]|uniref:RING-type domain-containing protein n=1 Tax=Nippostrongylus brasiliensis TaxID=27835 RepID=A0A158QZN1_NIPBR|nr:unnamed protein product [Nippostrongylus brasiliensis]